MNRKNSHTDTLFHYTKSEDILMSILKEGLKFGYCKEWLNKDLCVGIPMISFCDIPISQSVEHSSKYGKYAIGLSKDYLISSYAVALGPVNYYISPKTYKGAFKLLEISKEKKRKFDEQIKRTPKTITITLDGIKYVGGPLSKEEAPSALKNFIDIDNYHQIATAAIGLMKPYQSEGKNGKQVNYDECEWRLVMPENARLSDSKICKWFWTEQELEKWRKSHGNKFLDVWNLPFDVSDINYLIVPDNNAKSSIIKAILNVDSLCGIVITNEDKNTLCSKVVSLEQIDNDL